VFLERAHGAFTALGHFSIVLLVEVPERIRPDGRGREDHGRSQQQNGLRSQ
jgi:hypothetical protein